MKRDIGLYGFRRPESQLLSDLSAVQADLRRVVELLEPLKRAKPFQGDDQDIQELRWDSAIVRYARAFPPGVLRWPWQDTLARLSDEDRNIHSYVMDLRNGHIAHSIGALEDWVPTVQISKAEDGSLEVQSINCGHTRYVGASEELIADFSRLVAQVVAHVEGLIAAEKATLLGLARTLDPNEMMKDGIWTGNLDDTNPRKSRERY